MFLWLGSFYANRSTRITQTRNIPRSQLPVTNQAAFFSDFILVCSARQSVRNPSVLTSAQNNQLTPVGQTIDASNSEVHANFPLVRPVENFCALRAFLWLNGRDHSFRKDDAISSHAITIAVSAGVAVDHRVNSLHTCHLAISRESLGRNLVHVVVLVSCQTANKVHVWCRIRKRLVARVQIRILLARHRIIGVAL